MEADEKIKRVDTENRQSTVLSPSPSLFPTIIFDIVCYFCGIFITKSGGCSRFSGRPSLLCSAVQTVSVTVDNPRKSDLFGDLFSLENKNVNTCELFICVCVFRAA